jgi:hypothetical protein
MPVQLYDRRQMYFEKCSRYGGPFCNHTGENITPDINIKAEAKIFFLILQNSILTNVKSYSFLTKKENRLPAIGLFFSSQVKKIPTLLMHFLSFINF